MDAIELQIRRIRMGIRQYTLAANLGIHPSYLSQIENGRSEPSPDLLRRIKKVLDPNGTMDD